MLCHAQLCHTLIMYFASITTHKHKCWVITFLLNWHKCDGVNTFLNNLHVQVHVSYLSLYLYGLFTETGANQTFDWTFDWLDLKMLESIVSFLLSD